MANETRMANHKNAVVGKTRVRRATELACAGLAVALFARPTFAADATWNIDTAGNWVDDTNWDPIAAPGLAEAILFP